MTWPERVFLPNGGALDGREWLNLLRAALFSPLFIAIWIIYVSRIVWLIMEPKIMAWPLRAARQFGAVRTRTTRRGF